jgi:hypothetical protein
MSNYLPETVNLIKDIVNILFFVVVGTIGVLTYLQAKKTIFMPFRTETFKAQLKLFEEIFTFLEQNNRDLFIHTFDYRKIFGINAYLLLDTYAHTFFDGNIEIDKNIREYMQSELPIINMAPKHIDKFKNTENGLIFDFWKRKDKYHDYSEKLAHWQHFEYVAVHITSHFQEQMDQLDRFISSPLLPDSIKTLVREFQIEAYHNLHIMADAFTKAAKQLPNKYSSPESLINADTSWLWNMIIEKRVALEDLAKKIYDRLNQYLNINNLLK